MSKTIFPALLLVFFAFGLKAQKGVDFAEVSWVEALDSASKTNKLIFLDACVGWSQPCSIFDKFALENSEVAAFYNQNFINIRMDMEAFPGVELAEFYEVYAYPSLLFINGEGKVIHRGCGVLNEEEMLALASEALGEKNLNYYRKKFEAGDRTAQFVAEYSMLLDAACMDKSALVNAYFRTVKSENWTNEASWNVINLNVSEPYSDEFQYLLDHKAEFARKYGKDTVDQKIHDVLLDQFIAIYEGADVTLFATQALKRMLSNIEFTKKQELESLVDMKYADLKQNWDLYANSAVKVVDEQEVTDPDQLNEFGWKFYLFVNDQEKLKKAVEWMEGVLDQYPEATYLDTYASLLYKTGEQKQAIKYAEMALEAAQYEAQDLMHYEAQLEKFEKGY